MLSGISGNQLTFTWNSHSTNLAGVQYFIVNASNCLCPNTTNSNSVNCSFSNNNISKQLQCSLTVRAVVCGRIGSASDPFIVTIKGQLLQYIVIVFKVTLTIINFLVPDPPRV